MFKQLTLSLIALLSTQFSFAGTMGNVCVPTNVTVPCESQRWNLGVQALYLQPTYTSDKGYEFGLNNGIHTVNPQWGWAYQLEGSYHFYTGNDITLTYLNYDNQSHHRDYSSYAGLIPFAFSIKPFTQKVENRFDQVNLVFGQQAFVSPRKDIRFYGGLQYAKFRIETDNAFTSVPLALIAKQVTGVAQYRNEDFDGVGPTLGADFGFHLVNGFSVTGNSAIALLYGTHRTNSGFVIAPSGVVFTAKQFSQKAVVPNLQTKLGLSYQRNWLEGTLQLEVGYEALNYFNALQTVRSYTLANYVNGSDFALHGPYLGAKWVGYV